MIDLDLQLRKLRDLIEENLIGSNGVFYKRSHYAKILNTLDKIYRIRTMEIREKDNVLIHVGDLADIIGLSASTIVGYIGNYRFSGYIPNKGVSPNTRLSIDTDFIKNMIEFLRIRKKEKNADNLKKWWDKDKRIKN